MIPNYPIKTFNCRFCNELIVAPTHDELIMETLKHTLQCKAAEKPQAMPVALTFQWACPIKGCPRVVQADTANERDRLANIHYDMHHHRNVNPDYWVLTEEDKQFFAAIDVSFK